MIPECNLSAKSCAAALRAILDAGVIWGSRSSANSWVSCSEAWAAVWWIPLRLLLLNGPCACSSCYSNIKNQIRKAVDCNGSRREDFDPMMLGCKLLAKMIGGLTRVKGSLKQQAATKHFQSLEWILPSFSHQSWHKRANIVSLQILWFHGNSINVQLPALHLIVPRCASQSMLLVLRYYFE